MARIKPLPCPECSRPIEVFAQDGGRGTGDLTSYYVKCVCGVNQRHLGSDGTKASAIRDWNRWVKERLGLPARRPRQSASKVPIVRDMRLDLDVSFSEDAVRSCDSLLSNLRCLFTTSNMDLSNAVAVHIAMVERIEADLVAKLAELRAAQPV
jgi:hypothetical protein